MKQHHPSCEPDTEPCACKALARNDAAWSSVDRRHWPSYAAGINDACPTCHGTGLTAVPGAVGPVSIRCMSCSALPPCTRCGGKGMVYVPSTNDPGDVVPDVCEVCRG
jgi:hypothetical protein